MIDKLTSLITFMNNWFNAHTGAGLVPFFKALGTMLVNILTFLIDFIKAILGKF